MITKFKIYEGEQLDIIYQYVGQFFLIDNNVYYLYDIEIQDTVNYSLTVLVFLIDNYYFSNHINKSSQTKPIIDPKDVAFFGNCNTIIVDRNDILNYKYYSVEDFCDKYEDACVKIYNETVKENRLGCCHVREELLEKLEKLEPIKVITDANKFNL